MKLFGKMTLMTLAVIIVASLGFLSPMMVGGTVHGATEAPVISLTAYAPTLEYGTGTENGYKLPSISTSITGATVTVTATNSAGKKIATTKVGDDWYFAADKPGKYNIVYTATSDGMSTSTQGITVEIVSKGATLAFDENSAQIIPTVAYKGNKIVFPRAKIMVDGEEDANLSKLVTTKLTNAAGVEKATFAQTSTGNMEYTIADGDSGDFKVVYTYSNAGKTLSQTETFRVNSTEQEVALKYANNLSSSLENLNLEVGVEATLPKPTVVNSKAGDVDITAKTYTEITVVDPQGTSHVITDFKFTPKHEGNYRITYKTVDFFDNEVSVSIQRDKIKLTSNSLTVKAVKAYNPTETGFSYADLDLDEWESHDYDIASVVYIEGENGVTATFPAIIAKGGWGGYNNLKLTRTIWKNGNTVGTLESAHSIGGSDTVTYQPYEAGQYHFTDEGSYEIVYSAIYLDSEGAEISNTRKSLSSYKFEVKRDTAPTSADATHLSITAPSISSLAVLKNADEKITFNAPSVSDDLDKRLQVIVEYKFNGMADAITATKNENGKYEIEIKDPEQTGYDWNTATSLEITFKVVNDFGQEKTVTKTISLLDFSSDAVAPTFSAKGNVSFASGKITVPTTTVTDTATNVSLVMYVMKGNKVVDIYNGNSTNTTTGHVATIDTFEYEPTQEGDYTFVFVATDQNHNTTTFSSSCVVDFHLGYSVSISSIPTQEYGDILDLTSVISVTKKGEVINIANENITIASEVTEAMVEAMSNSSMLIQVTGAYVIDQFGPNGRIKCLDGDIYVKAWVKDASGVCDFDNNASAEVSFKSTDTKAPEFTVEGEMAGTDVLATYAFADNDADNTHTLPWFEEINDNGTGVSLDSLKVELTYSTSTTPFKTFTIEDANTANGLDFIATQQGKIKVVYTAADEGKGNTATREFWIYIGDVTAPEIIVANDAITAPTKVGENVTINLNEVTFDDETLTTSSDLKVTVKHNGEEIDWEYEDATTKESIVFAASEAGEYVITFDATDKAGNKATTVAKTVKVNAESVKTTNSSTVWGTIMIIIALVVVAGVIYFFVKPSKVKIKGNNSKKSK